MRGLRCPHVTPYTARKPLHGLDLPLPICSASSRGGIASIHVQIQYRLLYLLVLETHESMVSNRSKALRSSLEGFPPDDAIIAARSARLFPPLARSSSEASVREPCLESSQLVSLHARNPGSSPCPVARRRKPSDPRPRLGQLRSPRQRGIASGVRWEALRTQRNLQEPGRKAGRAGLAEIGRRSKSMTEIRIATKMSALHEHETRPADLSVPR